MIPIAANADCEASSVDVKLKTPTISDLKVTDNCTSSENDYTIEWTRNYNGTVSTNLEAPYLVGTTLITWIVKDNAGNESTCEQKVVVTDTIGPDFDCDLLVDINVSADANCQATAEDVIIAGLRIPTTTADDKCSPTGQVVSGVGTRSDGKDVMTDPYSLGVTVITWTFTDGSENKTICTQNVIVTDNTAPVFLDCDNLKDIIINLEKDICEADIDRVKDSLGTQSAIDNCSTIIVGVPGVGEAGSEILPESFPVGTTIVTWVFDDKKGNITYCEQKVIVNDTIPGDTTGVCPKEPIHVDATIDCDATFDMIDFPELSIIDKCDGIILPDRILRSDNKDYKKDPYIVRTATSTWYSGVAKGNESTCSPDVIVA